MRPDEELYPGSDFENGTTDMDSTDTESISSDEETKISDQDTFGEQIQSEDMTDGDTKTEDDQIGEETPLDRLREDSNY